MILDPAPLLAGTSRKATTTAPVLQEAEHQGLHIIDTLAVTSCTFPPSRTAKCCTATLQTGLSQQCMVTHACCLLGREFKGFKGKCMPGRPARPCLEADSQHACPRPHLRCPAQGVLHRQQRCLQLHQPQDEDSCGSALLQQLHALPGLSDACQTTAQHWLYTPTPWPAYSSRSRQSASTHQP